MSRPMTLSALASRMVASVVIVGAAASACTSPDQPTASGSTTSATSQGSPTGSTTTTKGKGSAQGSAVGARSDLAGFSCTPSSSGVWSATGTLENSTKASAKYTVRISVALTKSSSEIGSSTKVLTLEAGKRQQFSVDAIATHSPKGVECFAHVTRTPAG